MDEYKKLKHQEAYTKRMIRVDNHVREAHIKTIIIIGCSLGFIGVVTIILFIMLK